MSVIGTTIGEGDPGTSNSGAVSITGGTLSGVAISAATITNTSVSGGVISKPTIYKTTTSVSVGYTAVATDYYVFVDASASAVTINLPTAVGKQGQEIVVKKINTNTNDVKVSANGAQTIDASVSYTLTGATRPAITIVSDNVNWWVV